MKDMDTEYKEFIVALKTAEETLGVAEIAKKYGCTPQYIYQIINESKPAGRRVQLKLAKVCGYKTIGEFINSKLKIPKGNFDSYSKQQPISFQDTTEKKHFEAIKKFKNKETGLEVNEFLVRLESLNVRKFHQIIGDIKGLVYELEELEKDDTLKKNYNPTKTGTDQ